MRLIKGEFIIKHDNQVLIWLFVVVFLDEDRLY